VSANNVEDYWTQQASSLEKPSERQLQIGTIDGVEPLNSQFGITQPKTVPDVLREPLLGQPEPTAAELAVEVDPIQIPPLHTYAILDAARVSDLPELLDASGLEHRCLFRGDAYDELKDVAPWIVRIEAGNSFTRNLFTLSDAVWHLWDKEPGIYIRSRGSLDDMWAHFRKFTRVKDEDGKWFYFRFWEPREFAEIMSQDGMGRLIRPSKGFGIHAIYAPTREKTYSVRSTSTEPEETPALILNSGHRTAFDSHIEGRFARDFSEILSAAAPAHLEVLGVSEKPPIAAMVNAITGYLKPLGFTKRSDIGRLASCALFYGTHFLHDPRIVGLSQLHLSNLRATPGLRAKRFEQALQHSLSLGAVAQKNGIALALPHLRSALDTMDLPQHWLSQVYTPALGFVQADMAPHFAQVCKGQQAKHGLSDPERQKAHYVLSTLYTPYFIDDPLHQALASIFIRKDNFKKDILLELERRIELLEKN
jgi:hypothetical protein